MENFFVYIMSSKSKVLYTGFTDDLETRVFTHKKKLLPGFTARYNVTRLVYYEDLPEAESALDREKQIKGWLRVKKIALIESVNPEWKDLSEGWFDE